MRINGKSSTVQKRKSEKAYPKKNRTWLGWVRTMVLFSIVFSHGCCWVIRWPIVEHLPINSHYIASKLSISANYWRSYGEWLVAVKLVNTYNMFCVTLIHRTTAWTIHIHTIENSIGNEEWHFWELFLHELQWFFLFVIVWNPIADTAQQQKQN